MLLARAQRWTDPPFYLAGIEEKQSFRRPGTDMAEGTPRGFCEIRDGYWVLARVKGQEIRYCGCSSPLAKRSGFVGTVDAVFGHEPCCFLRLFTCLGTGTGIW